MKKKILYAAGHSRAAYKWGMVGEVLKRLMEDPDNEIYYLDCNGNVKGPCGLNHHKHIGYCRKCNLPCLKVVEQAGLPSDHILRMEKYKAPKFPDFKTIEEMRDFDYEGYNYGLGPVSCMMTVTRDYSFDVKKYQKYIKRFFETEYVILKNIEHFDSIYHFDEIHTFNGRMASMYPYVSYAKKNNMPYTIYECGAKIDSLLILKNTVPHNHQQAIDMMHDLWKKSGEDRNELAQKWFDDRRGGKFQQIESYTKDQIKGSLPEGFDSSKENIAYFNSSIDEYAAFPGWELPFSRNENEIIEKMLEHYKNDENKHFYLRIHPNLKKAKRKKTTQMRELAEIKKKYKNVTIIEPEEKLDSYALVEAADKVITSISTMGCEATYWGAVSISVGNPAYKDLDCVYSATSQENLYELIDNKDLKVKPKENTYPLGYYYETYGEKFKYFQIKTRLEGDFLGLKLYSK